MMFQALKDWRVWLADWPLYVAGASGTAAMVASLAAGFAFGGALAGAFLFGLLIYAIRADMRS
jgi:hypothetical protein